MELVEIIRGAKTSDETVATIVALSKRIRKTPIVVNDCAGFLVNRVLFPYMNESLILLHEGVSMDSIDRAATRFGMPMGPLALTDMVGLQTACLAGKLLAHAYPDRAATSPILPEMLEASVAGGKEVLKFWTSEGKRSRPQANPAVLAIIAKHRTGNRTITDEDITDRLFLPMLLEATRVLEEGIVREPGDVDMGLIFGIGFPPFRGGILRWADTVGAKALVEKLEKYKPLGKRYEPTESLLKLARDGGTFYPRPKLGAS
jgi:3-hydroxyacyl-CoA dehydrogenase/enoyl-CoA hydratase/3-hydroxybutyryl-CoA epimerase/enoyl-CoA isomerase